MKEILHLRPYLSRYRRDLVLGGGALLLTNFFTLLGPWATKYAVDDITRGASAGKFQSYALLLVGLAVVQGVFRYYMRQILIGVSRLIEYDLRNDLYKHLLALSADYYERTKTGDVMARATNDLNAVRTFLGPGIMNFLGTIVTFVIAVSFMASVDLRLTIFALLPLPILSVLVKRLGSVTHQLFEDVQAEYANLTARVQENLAGIRVVKAFAEEESEIAAFRDANDVLVAKNLNLIRVWSAFFPVMSLLAGVAAAIVLYAGGSSVVGGRLTLGEFVAFNGYLALLIWPTIALGWVMNLLQRGAASMGRIQEILDERPAVVGGARPPAAVRGEIALDAVSFRYGRDGSGVDDVSETIRPGMTVAIVGETGSGKSTLVELLPRVHDPSAGAIRIDGVDTRELPLPVLRRAIGMVPQEPFLFSDTIRANIGYGIDDAPEAERERRIVEAAKAAGIWREIEAFPKGLDTLLGERGVNLSGGQKQRVTLARAIATDPPILVLDDALASVDTGTEAEILANLRTVFAGRTNILIAHRLSMVQAADLILVLEGGRVVERGTHAELLRDGRVYPRIYERELLKQELDRM
jgi:ATP-binding cassette subfamily B protein